MSGCLFTLKPEAGWILLFSLIHLTQAQGKDADDVDLVTTWSLDTVLCSILSVETGML